MTRFAKTLEIRTSPHILSGHSVDAIMFNVVLALVPAMMFSVFAFGLAALLTLAVAVASCVLTEHWTSKRALGRSTIGDWSIVITGILFGLTLPPGLPLWMSALGGVICALLGKAVFGGLGQNPFNPALVGRATLQAAFPVSMTTWLDGFTDGRFATMPSSTLTFPFAKPVYDAVSGATPLALWKFEHTAVDVRQLAFGMTSGSMGETSSVLILLGGAYLIARNMMNWRIPTAMLSAAFTLSAGLHVWDSAEYASPMLMLFSGGLALGAVFMASDMVGSPMTNLGCWIYGAFIGITAIVIRTFGAMPEGVMYAILLGNALSPQIDHVLQPRVYGTAKKEKTA